MTPNNWAYLEVELADDGFDCELVNICDVDNNVGGTPEGNEGAAEEDCCWSDAFVADIAAWKTWALLKENGGSAIGDSRCCDVDDKFLSSIAKSIFSPLYVFQRRLVPKSSLITLSYLCLSFDTNRH